MKHTSRRLVPCPNVSAVVLFLVFSVCTTALAGTPAPCVVPDNGGGTVDLPPAGCGYVSPNDLHKIIDGLPAGTEIRIDPIHDKFFNDVRNPGGNLGGEIEEFDSNLTLQMTGTGALAGFSRTIFVPVHAIVHSGPRNPGDDVQTFNNDMFFVQGEIFGDPDFDVLRVEGGTAFGLPSPGQTTLTRTPSGDFNVDSFFDITYRITFQGAPGSILDGMSGTTTDTVTMAGGVPAQSVPPCIVPDNGTGTVDLPPPGCSYVSPDDLHLMIDGLPPGTQINVAAEHFKFFQVQTFPGGNLGGEIEQFQSILQMDMTGTGQLAGFQRTLFMQLGSEAHTGPRNPGDPVQTFPNDMFLVQGEIFGDPDFDLLRVRGGTAFGLPSPGQTTLTDLGDGNFNVDSFFDITYEIEFVGAPGSVLDGFGGTTTASVEMQSGQPATGQQCQIPPGDDQFPSTAKLVLQLFDGTEPFVVRLSSADLPDTIVQRGPQVGRSIDTEMVSLSLSGFHPRTGPINVSLGQNQATLGRLDDIVQGPFPDCDFISADSFFDVIVDIDLPALGETWSCDRPLHLERKLHSLPPRDERYENPFVDPIVLIDNASGQPRGQIVYELHHADPPFPPPGQDCIDTFLDARLTIPPLGVFNEPISVQGPTTVLRAAPAPETFLCTGPVPVPCNGDGDCPTGETCSVAGLRSVQTEMLSMDLTGFNPFLGEIVIREDPDLPSPGQTTSQQPGRTYRADSQMDVRARIDLPDLGISNLRTEVPVPVTGIGSSGQDGVRNLPPDPQTSFRSPPNQEYVILLEDGTPIGDIRNVNHRIDTPRDWQPPPPEDEDCFDSWVHLEITIFNPFCTETVWLNGNFRVLRDAPADPSASGQEIIETLMAKGVFNGNSSCVGPLRVRMARDQTSGGAVSSLAPAEFFPADSFFDIFMVADTGIGRLHAQDPASMRTTINSLPPEDGEIYFGPGTVIPIYDDAGSLVGEILEVSHEVHNQIDCPDDCYPRMRMGVAVGTAPGGGGGVAINKNAISFPIPLGGGGVQYDLARGDLSFLRGTGGDMSDASCLSQDGGPVVIDPAIPALGDGYYYVGRDGFKAFNGTWDAKGAINQVASRDGGLPKINACPP